MTCSSGSVRVYFCRRRSERLEEARRSRWPWKKLDKTLNPMFTRALPSTPCIGPTLPDCWEGAYLLPPPPCPVQPAKNFRAVYFRHPAQRRGHRRPAGSAGGKTLPSLLPFFALHRDPRGSGLVEGDRTRIHPLHSNRRAGPVLRIVRIGLGAGLLRPRRDVAAGASSAVVTSAESSCQ